LRSFIIIFSLFPLKSFRLELIALIIPG